MTNNVTTDINGAADLLNMHPDALTSIAQQGKIRGAMIGKQWVFFKEDLVAWLSNEMDSQLQKRLSSTPKITMSHPSLDGYIEASK